MNPTLQLLHRSNQPIWKALLAGSTVRPGDLPAKLADAATVLQAVADRFPMKINPYLLSLIRSAGDPIGRQVIPSIDELKDNARTEDPLSEEQQAPVPQVIHRYPHRVVFLVSNQCAVHCRFCMRKRRVAGDRQVPQVLVQQGLDYIRSQSRINEVILSGGDPLMLDDGILSSTLKALRDIGHIRLLRIHTRIPSLLPQRVTPELARLLSEVHPLYVNIHFNHPTEITSESVAACRLLADAGICLGSQTVLLKGINDNARVLHELFEELLRIRVRPYYLHQLDRVPGTAHFRVPLHKSLQLMEALRGSLSGMAIPHFMIDLPGGGGKVALTTDRIVRKGPAEWQVRNWQGKTYRYPA